ncbi:MAG: hypothetical protein JXR37_20860 [Kiritimatiellae bacterium]|nr:hypothetical protein [Kiritimatiellia bacterium]
MNRLSLAAVLALTICVAHTRAGDRAHKSLGRDGVIFHHDFNSESLHTYTAADLKRVWHTRNVGGLVPGVVKVVHDPHPSRSHGKVLSAEGLNEWGNHVKPGRQCNLGE